MDDAIALRLPQLQRSLNTYFSEFRQARRLQNSLLSHAEKKALLWLAARTPAAINSDHLTALGLLGMLGAGLCYFAARWHSYGLDRKSTRLNSSHSQISYAVFCL